MPHTGMYLRATDCCNFYDYRNRAIIMMSSRKIPKQPMESRPTPPRAGFSFPGDTQLALPILSDTASHGRRSKAKD